MLNSLKIPWAARDSNPQRHTPTDLQSAPALQLRRPPDFSKTEHQIYLMTNKNASYEEIDNFKANASRAPGLNYDIG
jgi:hypothetical protein